MFLNIFLALKSYLVMILDRLIVFLVIKKSKFDCLERPITVNFLNQKQAMQNETEILKVQWNGKYYNFLNKEDKNKMQK